MKDKSCEFCEKFAIKYFNDNIRIQLHEMGYEPVLNVYRYPHDEPIASIPIDYCPYCGDAIMNIFH